MTSTLIRAGPAEILRAAQKDEVVCEKLRNSLSEIVLQIGVALASIYVGVKKNYRFGWLKIPGTQVLVKYRDLLGASGNLLYYGTTTLSGLQTLGEEYTGVIQYDSSSSSIPTLRKRVLMILLCEFGQKLINLFLLNIQQNHLKNNESSLRPEARQLLTKAIAYLKIMVPFLERLHRAVFYWSGYYGQVSKRMTGIQYVLVRYWLKNRESLYGFKLLSIATLLQTLISGTMKSVNFFNNINKELSMQQSTSDPVSSSVLDRKKCPLCLDVRKNVSLTPCGHLFCWYCILKWVQNEQKCPVCRECVLPSRVVPLQHYS